MARGRVFTRVHNPDLTRQLCSGEKRPAQLCRERGLAESLLWRRRREFEAARRLATEARPGFEPSGAR
ncbi:MAG TPA: hypothetical protein VH482_30320 [Thermomicrobiales bacterium]|jgi:hypothetical protein